MARLDEIFNLQMGKTPSRNNTGYWIEGKYDWISIADLSTYSKYTGTTKERISEVAVQESGIKRVPENTVIMSFKLSLGKTAITKESIYTNEAIMAFIPTGKYAVLPDYFYHLFSTMNWSKGTNRAVMGTTLNKATLGAISIIVPPLSEQRKIAAVLDKVSDLITKHRQQLDKLDELVKSRFIEMFIGKGYPTKTVDEVSLSKGEYGAQSASVEYDPNRPRYVRITDINDDGTLNDDMVASINLSDDEQYRLEYGDFMFARMGATVGKTYAFITGNQIFAGYLIRYKLNQNVISPRYLFWYTKLDVYWNWVKLSQSGAAQPGINAKKFGSLRIPVPPIELQRQFVTFVEQTDKSKLAIKQSLEKLETLKKSLMQQYFG